MSITDRRPVADLTSFTVNAVTQDLVEMVCTHHRCRWNCYGTRDQTLWWWITQAKMHHDLDHQT